MLHNLTYVGNKLTIKTKNFLDNSAKYDYGVKQNKKLSKIIKPISKIKMTRKNDSKLVRSNYRKRSREI
jgi:hypothetical protein